MYDAKRSAAIEIGAGAAKDLSATGVFATTFNLLENVRVWRLVVKVTTSISSTGAVVVALKRRPTYGSSSGEVNLGTVSIPAAAVANAVYYKDITPYNCLIGDQLVFDCTTAASTSGAAIAGFLADFDPEAAANSVMIASA